MLLVLCFMMLMFANDVIILVDCSACKDNVFMYNIKGRGGKTGKRPCFGLQKAVSGGPKAYLLRCKRSCFAARVEKITKPGGKSFIVRRLALLPSGFVPGESRGRRTVGRHIILRLWKKSFSVDSFVHITAVGHETAVGVPERCVDVACAYAAVIPCPDICAAAYHSVAAERIGEVAFVV